jgi:predicted  nucleic acid-binding Zn-ribbon protein
LSPLDCLLDLQELDLACDRLARKRRDLPEREALLRADEAALPLEAAHETLLSRRAALGISEKSISGEVSELSARAKEAERTLYSGSVRASKELSALQNEMLGLRSRQSELEARELGLLEELEGAEAEIVANRAERALAADASRRCSGALASAEGDIDAELATLLAARVTGLAAIPAEILTAYEKLRKRERLAGRAAARIAEGGCTGCHMRLPVHEHNLLQARPADALLICVHCGRILVRSSPTPAG